MYTEYIRIHFLIRSIQIINWNCNNHMKWYKKQIDKLKKESDQKFDLSGTQKKKIETKYHDPVKARNKNRPKTDCH